jgi:hypothetical protein
MLGFEKRYLFYGGMLNLLLYLAADIVGGLLTPDYVFKEHAVSELMLEGAEFRTMVSAMIFASSLAGLAFGIGFLLHFQYSKDRLMFVAGILLTVSALITSFTSTIFPQDPRDGDVTFAGTMHLTLVGLNVLITIIAMLLCGIGLNRKFGWKRFRLYSVITLVVMAVGGVVSTVFIQNDIQWLGVSERVSIYAYFVWNAVMAWLLLQAFSGKDPGGLAVQNSAPTETVLPDTP